MNLKVKGLTDTGGATGEITIVSNTSSQYTYREELIWQTAAAPYRQDKILTKPIIVLGSQIWLGTGNTNIQDRYWDTWYFNDVIVTSLGGNWRLNQTIHVAPLQLHRLRNAQLFMTGELFPELEIPIGKFSCDTGGNPWHLIYLERKVYEV